MRFNLLPPASDPPRPSQSPLTCLSHILFSLFRFCFFVSEFSHFAYNFCPSYFLPVPRNTISLPPAPSLSFISRLLSVSPATLSIRLSSPPLLRLCLSSSCALGTSRALSKSRKDMYVLPLSCCARCHSGLHAAGKESLCACVQSRCHWQIDVFITMSFIARA